MIAGRLLIFILTGGPAFAQSPCTASIPKGPAFDFARVILSEKNSASRQRAEMSGACTTLNMNFNTALNEDRKKSKIQKPGNVTDQFKMLMKSNRKVDLAKLGTSAIETKFSGELDAVKKNPDAMTRMKAVYELVRKYQGRYEDPAVIDLESWHAMNTGEDPFPSPSKTLMRAQEKGSGGICRDFAALLVWSLKQVASSPTGQEQFAVDYSTTPSHVVANVKMKPATDGKFDWGNSFALDSTNFESFTPIPVPDLNASDAEMKARLESCDRILNCLSTHKKPVEMSSVTGGEANH